MKQKVKQDVNAPSKQELLNICFTQKGEISKCFNLFRQYSVNNIIWLYNQMKANDLPITPVKTLKQWNDLGRKVVKGSKGLYMTEMRQFFSKTETELNTKTGKEEPKLITYFPVTKNHFCMAQTDGVDYSEQLKDYYKLNISNIMDTLKIKKIDFNRMNGNIQGYANGKREVAINPLDKQCLQTVLHEIAHIVLKHNGSKMIHPMREVEAESVNFIICSLVDSEQDLNSSRAYVQAHLKELKIEDIKDLPDDNAKRIFEAVDIILKASDNKTKEYKVIK